MSNARDHSQMAKTDTTSRMVRNKATPVYQRLVLKLSGESLSGPQGSGIHAETIQGMAHEVKEVRDLGVQVAIMVGGGNIFRGTRQKELAIDRATGDYMGMLATVINGLALVDALEKAGCFTRLMSAIEMHQVAEPFIRRRATRRRDFCGRHWQPLLFDRHRGGPARHGNQSPGDSESNARGWCV
jgi:Amino acid kinase family